MRIVSLLPSATEIVYSLGLGDDLVGVTYECDHPSEARAKPVVSDTALPLQPGLGAAEIDRLVSERVAAGEALYVLDTVRIRDLEPDLIITQDLCRVCAVPSGQVEDALAKLGCSAEVVSLDPHSLDDILVGITEVGRRAGAAERAAEVVDGLRTRIAAVDEAARGLPPVPTVTLEWLDPPFAGGHWVPEMVERAGGEHLLVAAGEPSRRVSWDDVGATRPEVVVAMQCGYHLAAARAEAAAVLPDRPAVAESPAGKAGRVFAVDANGYFSRSGPRVVDGLEALAWALHPDRFPTPPEGIICRLP
ncbi:MAG: cobalamin-binding protein [Actinomycetota bacterium]|nr:cobalamin-binding protein [Actinomycetota bacterium]